MLKAPICPSCGKEAVQTRTRFGDRHDCCGLWSWGGKPLADRDTHKARQDAHAAFDRLWKGAGSFTRSAAYRAAAKALGITPQQMHIAQFTKEQCEKLIAVAPTLRNPARHRKTRSTTYALSRNPNRR